MKLRVCAIVWALTLVAAPAAVEAQTRQSNRTNQAPQASMQFDDHARQATRDWYNQHQSNPPAGFRSRDRLSADQESRLQPGRPLDPDLRQHVHSVPRDLSRQLPPPPPNHRYVAIGGHVGMVDNGTHILRDVIHLNNR
jgi:Ni/Co efflux regulator RcnB